MYDGFLMGFSHNQKVVARLKTELLLVDTYAFVGSNPPYETAVAHPEYNQNRLVVVETYNTKKEARIGHKKWVKRMTAKKLPKRLLDTSAFTVAKLARG